jgi:hypothetical protein
VLTFRSEIAEVPFIDVVLNLKIAVYWTLRLNTLYLVTFRFRWNSKLRISVTRKMLCLVVEILLNVVPLRPVIVTNQ